MLYHPTIIILIYVILLIASYKHDKIFNFLAILLPVGTAIKFFSYAESGSAKIANLVISFKFDETNKLISTAFFCVLFAANLYSIGQKKKLEIIFGSCYGAFAFTTLFANDFISMFIGLELMVAFSSIIIFIGGAKDSLRSAKKYFITHLLSSNMIAIGIAHLIIKNKSLEIVSATYLISDPSYSSTILYIMLVGMLINIAAFPFSGWMVKYYPKASPSGFLYLISFTTKVSIILLAKIFPASQELKYIAITMILYSSIKATREENIFSLLCYLSIMSMGLILLGISIGTKEAILATTGYLFIHIIYKMLLSISAATLSDEAKITNYYKIRKINNNILLLGIIAGILIMVSLPPLPTFIIKTNISNLFHDYITYISIVFLSFMTVFVLPWKKYFISKTKLKIKLNLYSKLSIIFMTILLISISIWGELVPVLNQLSNFREFKLLSIDAIKQLIIILCGIIASYIYSVSRKDTKPINFIEWIGYIFSNFYIRRLNINATKEPTSEPWAIENLEKQIARRLKVFHNQQTAIFIVFTAFIVILLVLTTSIV